MTTSNSPELPTGSRNWKTERDADGCLWIGANQPDSGANVLSRAALEEFAQLLLAIEASPPSGVVIYSAKKGTFIAGADINEFPKIRNAAEAYALVRQGQQVMDKLESLPCPTVAVINGFALGGGLELALACRWRVALEGEEPCMGLPEVQLGVHPGFGGTVRLPRLTGVRHAMDLMLTGRSVKPAAARLAGLVDALANEDNWRTVAASLARRARVGTKPPLLDQLMAFGLFRGMVASSLANRIRLRANPKQLPAPFAIVDLWRDHYGDPDRGMDAEARSFSRLLETPASRNLVRVFFLQERLKKAGGRAAQMVQRVHVVGAGIMGGDIAAWCAVRGLNVTLQDREMKFVEPALARADRLFAKRFGSDSERMAARARLVADIEGSAVARADLVIEAIFENPDAKRELYEKLQASMSPDALLATNTSSIPLQELSVHLRRPERFIGLHFFNPVAKLPLVEVVQTATTTAEASQAALAFVRQIGKLPVPCQSQPGFLVNRILAPYMAEAMDLAREGVALSEIDRAAVDFGMPVGPVELADSVGLDIALHVAKILGPATGRTAAPELERMVQEGNLGQKTGKGFYIYQNGKPVRPSGERHPVDPMVQKRLILSLVNEAADCLAEGVVADADLVDAGVIFGTGFAPFTGGPLQYARDRGIDRIVAELQELERMYGPRFAPSPGWDKLRNL